MIVYSKKEFATGILMALGFLVVLVVMFSPLFSGKNAFEAADDFFNSIAKGSTYYIPGLLKQVEPYQNKPLEVTIKLDDKDATAKAGKLLSAAGAAVTTAADGQIKATGDLGKLSRAVLQDADSMFHNRGKEVTDRYGFPEKEALVLWSKVLKEIEKDLKRQKKFEEAKWLSTITKKGVEVGYNFYGIVSKSASATAGTLILSLVFYVAYTMWWGYSILFLCEGFGLAMTSGAKKEM
jgi:hypothetical protein